MRWKSKLFPGSSKAQQGGPQELERRPADPPRVIVYTTSWCGSCYMAKRYLRENDIDYQEIDIERVPGSAEEVMSVARGYRTVPTFRIGGTVVVDWDQRAVASALRKEGFI